MKRSPAEIRRIAAWWEGVPVSHFSGLPEEASAICDQAMRRLRRAMVASEQITPKNVDPHEYRMALSRASRLMAGVAIKTIAEQDRVQPAAIIESIKYMFGRLQANQDSLE